MCSDNRTYTMQLTNETALPIAWIEAEGDSWGCDEEDCEYGEVRFIYTYSNTVMVSFLTFRRITRPGTSVTTTTGRQGRPHPLPG